MLRSSVNILTPVEPAWAHSNWQSYCVRLPENADQLEVMQSMLDEGIGTRRGIMCAHLEPAYANIKLPMRLCHSEQAQNKCILLPLFPDLTEEEQQHIVSTLRRACKIQDTPRTEASMTTVLQ